MLDYIESILAQFRSCFRRTPAFAWFVICVMALMVRSDHLGVTSFIRDLALRPECYECLLNFFRSTAYSNMSIRQRWIQVAAAKAPVVRVRNRAVLVGDGVKQSKEARRMPGVKKMAQESETSSKPQFIHGHLLGAVGVVIANAGKRLCLPLWINIQDGLRAMAGWPEADGIVEVSGKSHVEQMIECAFNAALSIGDSYLLLDRYFLTAPALKLLKKLNDSAKGTGRKMLEIVTKAKCNCIAYMKAPPRRPGQKGRPALKGKKINLGDLFKETQRFLKGKAWMYGSLEEVSYYCTNLLWGRGLYYELRFVLVEWKGARSILVTTDLSLPPLKAMELYGRRFSCEELFREMKQQIGAFCYHFWTKSLPRLSHFAKKSERDGLAKVTDPHQRKLVALTVKAMESFVNCSCVAMGTLQLISLQENLAGHVLRHRYLRTYSSEMPSEASVMHYLRKYIFYILGKRPDSFVTQFIQGKQKLPEESIGEAVPDFIA